MTSEKSYDNAQRLDALVPRVGTLEASIAGLATSAALTALAARVTALEALTGSGTMSDLGAVVETGSLANSWGKSAGAGYFKYQRIGRLCFIFARDLNPGTVADGTTICTAANGLASTCRPNSPQSLVANTDDLKQGVGSNSTSAFPVTISKEAAALHFQTDGSITCSGFTTAGTFCDCYGAFYLDA